MKKLWVDDLRNPLDFVDEGWEWEPSFYGASKMIQENNYEEISLDNDLGDELGREGKDILNRIEFWLYCNEDFLSNLKKIYVHTANPVAANVMMSVKENFQSKFGIEVIRTPMFD